MDAESRVEKFVKMLDGNDAMVNIGVVMLNRFDKVFIDQVFTRINHLKPRKFWMKNGFMKLSKRVRRK